MMMCIENMSAFDLSKRHIIVTGVLGLAVGIATGYLLTFFNIVTELRLELYYVYIGLVMTVYLSFVYKNVLKGLANGISGALLMFGIDGCTQYFFRLLGYTETPAYWNVVFIIFVLLMLAFVLLFRLYLKKRIDMNIFNSKSVYFITAICGVMIIAAYINYQSDLTDVSGDMMYALSFVSVVVMFVIVIRFVFKENAMRTEKLIAEASKKYINDLETSYTALRTVKHDYVNILSSFKLYIENRDMDGLAKYYYDELSEMNKDLLNQDRLMGCLQNVRINEIKSILIYKCAIAAQQQVETHIEAREPVDELGVSTAIVCQILGILLDNAVEAAAEAIDRSVSIAIIKNPHSKTFVIKNTWNQQEIAANKLFELGFSTKAKNRGVGLYTVRKYTDKITNLYLETAFTPDYFTQTLTVKDAL
jgi:two-component system sensor histidine kinase AgrC